MKIFNLLLSILIFTNIVFCQEAPTYKQHEVILGFGVAKSFEKNVFNVPDDVKGSPDIEINMAYFYHLSEQFAVGCHLYGFVQSKIPFMVSQNGNISKINLDLSSLNLGMQGRYFLSSQRFSPFVFAGINLVSGSVTGKEAGTLNHTGFSFCGGTGATLKLGESFALSLEALASLGSANWKQKPFLNSSGREFNPSLLSLTLNLSYMWGDPE
jgi:hypothetical protein